jgi:hypothetical protein
MTTEKLSIITASAKSIRAQLRMAYFMLLLYVIHLVEAYITFPFVDHTTVGQNVTYGLIVAAPCYITIIIFILVRRKDLAAAK